MVARSASFCATCRSIAATLAFCSAVWLTRKRRCIWIKSDGALGRLELGGRIVLSGQGRTQPCDIELSRDEVALRMPELGPAHGRIELDKDVAGLDALAVTDMDRTHDAGLERLDGLGAAARNDLAGRDGDNVDRADARPGQRNAEHGDDRGRDGAADRRGRRLDDLERRRQKREFVLSTLFALPSERRQSS